MDSFDTLIVGGGPAGMTLATYLPGRVCLVDHESLGGCHRVRRQQGLFAEHGPRVYSGANVNFRQVLRDVGVGWDATFRKTYFSPEHIDGRRWFQALSARELLVLSWEFTAFALWDPMRGRHTSMLEFCRRHGFSEASTRYLDAVCSFSDGAGADRYSLFEFLNGFDQHTLDSFYHPREANDRGFLAAWEAHIRGRGVQVLTGTHVASIVHREGRATGVRLESGRVLRAARVVLAAPPASCVPLLKASGLSEPGFEAFARATKYEPYWSVALHYSGKVLDHKGFRTTPWGLVYADLPLRGEPHRIVSVAASKWDVPSPRSGKTLRELTRARQYDAIVAEIVTQLGFGAQPVAVSIPYGAYSDTSFVAAAQAGFVDFALSCCSGLFTVGTHTGRSEYHFTSIESAVQNALVFCGQPTRPSVAASDILKAVLMAVAVWLMLRS